MRKAAAAAKCPVRCIASGATNSMRGAAVLCQLSASGEMPEVAPHTSMLESSEEVCATSLSRIWTLQSRRSAMWK
eukprot:7004251-Pyramimonas_sp.AAC.1